MKDLGDILAEFADDIADHIGYFHDPDDYEAWLEKAILNTIDDIVEWNNKTSV